MSRHTTVDEWAAAAAAGVTDERHPGRPVPDAAAFAYPMVRTAVEEALRAGASRGATPSIFADFGAGSGDRSLAGLKVAVQSWQRRVSAAPLLVAHSDAPGSDFATLFDSRRPFGRQLPAGQQRRRLPAGRRAIAVPAGISGAVAGLRVDGVQPAPGEQRTGTDPRPFLRPPVGRRSGPGGLPRPVGTGLACVPGPPLRRDGARLRDCRRRRGAGRRRHDRLRGSVRVSGAGDRAGTGRRRADRGGGRRRRVTPPGSARCRSWASRSRRRSRDPRAGPSSGSRRVPRCSPIRSRTCWRPVDSTTTRTTRCASLRSLLEPHVGEVPSPRHRRDAAWEVVWADTRDRIARNPHAVAPVYRMAAIRLRKKG